MFGPPFGISEIMVPSALSVASGPLYMEMARLSRLTCVFYLFFTYVSLFPTETCSEIGPEGLFSAVEQSIMQKNNNEEHDFDNENRQGGPK